MKFQLSPYDYMAHVVIVADLKRANIRIGQACDTLFHLYSWYHEARNVSPEKLYHLLLVSLERFFIMC